MPSCPCPTLVQQHQLHRLSNRVPSARLFARGSTALLGTRVLPKTPADLLLCACAFSPCDLDQPTNRPTEPNFPISPRPLVSGLVGCLVWKPSEPISLSLDLFPHSGALLQLGWVSLRSAYCALPLCNCSRLRLAASLRLLRRPAAAAVAVVVWCSGSDLSAPSFRAPLRHSTIAPRLSFRTVIARRSLSRAYLSLL